MVKIKKIICYLSIIFIIFISIPNVYASGEWGYLKIYDYDIEVTDTEYIFRVKKLNGEIVSEQSIARFSNGLEQQYYIFKFDKWEYNIYDINDGKNIPKVIDEGYKIAILPNGSYYKREFGSDRFSTNTKGFVHYIGGVKSKYDIEFSSYYSWDTILKKARNSSYSTLNFDIYNIVATNGVVYAEDGGIIKGQEELYEYNNEFEQVSIKIDFNNNIDLYNEPWKFWNGNFNNISSSFIFQTDDKYYLDFSIKFSLWQGLFKERKDVVIPITKKFDFSNSYNFNLFNDINGNGQIDNEEIFDFINKYLINEMVLDGETLQDTIDRVNDALLVTGLEVRDDGDLNDKGNSTLIIPNISSVLVKFYNYNNKTYSDTYDIKLNYDIGKDMKPIIVMDKVVVIDDNGNPIDDANPPKLETNLNFYTQFGNLFDQVGQLPKLFSSMFSWIPAEVWQIVVLGIGLVVVARIASR